MNLEIKQFINVLLLLVSFNLIAKATPDPGRSPAIPTSLIELNTNSAKLSGEATSVYSSLIAIENKLLNDLTAYRKIYEENHISRRLEDEKRSFDLQIQIRLTEVQSMLGVLTAQQSCLQGLFFFNRPYLEEIREEIEQKALQVAAKQQSYWRVYSAGKQKDSYESSLKLYSAIMLELENMQYELAKTHFDLERFRRRYILRTFGKSALTSDNCERSLP